MNAISSLAELESQQFPLVQSCVLPKLVSSSDDIRKASPEAEQKIDAHVQMCRFIIYYFFSLIFVISALFYLFMCSGFIHTV